ncbi:DUF4242 domain-containing protein [Rossellomorea oryzaecorticis]|jgi:Protein of unknown function (DUF4242)|uniref:DUF4242 domain-containing protein n=1 Tax=Rossellomorea oryzaecorticis TaxID=1396505 RepID=A0ABW8VPD9_9BACI|nr:MULTISPECIES: DUF4242 domain-containing protein [Bacillaceae]MBH9966156.1 DUF4242 domain-containing protein [[Bacillus] enclensis]QWC23620.1 DUF4242 domain-containing protein [Bacillus haikouensis]
MALFLVESTVNGVSNKSAFESKVEEINSAVEKKEVNLVEVQVSKDLSRTFFIFEGESQEAVSDSLSDLDLTVELVKEVRLVGKELDDVKKQADKVNYLVQWNLPENLTMDAYLDRKKKNSVHYAEVPEVSFSRTYVCEDMSKCLCFYDAPDEDAVKRAREAVNTPLDSITEIDNA